MFHAKLADGSILRKLVECIKDLVIEVNVEVTSAGMSIQAMDGSHIALVSLNLSAEGFEEYRCDKSMKLGISMTSFSKIMKQSTQDESVTLDCEESSRDKLMIQFDNSKLKKSTKYELALLTLDNEHLGIPDSQYNSVVTMSSNEFSKICKDLYSLSETVNISGDKSSIRFSITSDVINGGVTLEENDSGTPDEQCSIKINEEVDLAFALRYLNMFAKSGMLSQQVVLYLSKEYPLMVEYKIADIGTLQFYLAPRIPEEQ